MTEQNTQTQNRGPVKTFRDKAISVNIWKREHQNPDTGEISTFYSLDLRRGYKQGDNWKNTTSINGEDGLRVSNLYQRAHNWILHQKYPAQMQAAQPAQTQQAA